MKKKWFLKDYRYLFTCVGKILKIMRISIFLMVLTSFQAIALNNLAQTRKLELKVEKSTIAEALNKIEDETDYFFFYNNKSVSLDKVVSLDLKDKTISEILDVLFRGTNVEYTINNRQIILSGRDPGVYQTEQKRTVNGKVTDVSGSPLPGVTIVIKGTTVGTITDVDGKYGLTNVPNGATLLFSFVGMKNQEIPVTDKNNIDVTMLEETIGLEEVVAIGYGTMQKRDLTGSIGSLHMDEELSSRPVVDFGQAMYGKIAGVQVINGSGRPGTSSTIQIRGINSISAGSSPLVVIDGVQLPGYDLNSINSSDIASIEILKDASSAAIYGSRGANGVILVTTKSGEKGKSELRLNYTFSLQQVIRKIDVMNAAEYAQASIDAAQNGWIETGGDPNAPNTIEARGKAMYTWPEALEDPESLYDTDWQDVIFRMAPMHKVDLSFSGGNKTSTYVVSGGYVNQEGIVITSDYEKYTLNMKANSTIKNWLDLGGMLNVLYDHENEPYNRIVEWAVQYPSIYPVYGNNGYLGDPNTVDGFEDYYAILFRAKNGHPLYRINDDIQHRRFTTIGNLFAKINLYDGLSFRTSFNAFYKRSDNTDYQAGDHQMGPSYLSTVQFISNMSRSINYTWENLLTYDKVLGNHSINVMGGYEYNHRDYYYQVAERSNYDNDDIHYLAAGKTIYDADDNANESTLISYLARVNYAYRGKYLFSASYRRDGSSRFGPNSKWGNFPSFSAAWRLSEEAFMKSFQNLSNFKIRLSYGFTGNDNFSDYKWISQMTQAKVAIGNTMTTSYYSSSVENPDLEWERTKQLNFGIDLGLWNNRLNIEADAYKSVSDGLLLDVPVPSTSGFESVFTNIGEVENRGLELNISSHNLTGILSWSTQFTFSKNHNEVTKLGTDDSPMIYDPGYGMESINKIGEPLFSFYGYQYDGVYMNQSEIDADPAHYASATPGDGRYKDITGDGVLDSDDRTIIGNYQPDYTWGLTNMFKYKNFDFSFLFQGVVGSDVFDNNIHRSMLYHEGRNYYAEVNNRWRSEDDPGDGYHYKLTVNLDGYEKTASSYWIVDGTYLRLKDVTLGYNIPKKITQKAGISNVRVYFNGVNLFTISDSNVFDPENFNGDDATDAAKRGVTHSPYPSSRIYSFGINVEF